MLLGSHVRRFSLCLFHSRLTRSIMLLDPTTPRLWRHCCVCSGIPAWPAAHLPWQQKNGGRHRGSGSGCPGCLVAAGSGAFNGQQRQLSPGHCQLASAGGSHSTVLPLGGSYHAAGQHLYAAPLLCAAVPAVTRSCPVCPAIPGLISGKLGGGFAGEIPQRYDGGTCAGLRDGRRQRSSAREAWLKQGKMGGGLDGCSEHLCRGQVALAAAPSKNKQEQARAASKWHRNNVALKIQA